MGSANFTQGQTVTPSWIWGAIRIWDNCNPVGDMTLAGQSMGLSLSQWSGFPTSNSFTSNSACSGGCSSFSATWTDLMNGDVQIDIY